MLVLSRKAREEIVIPEYGIVVSILQVHGSRVRVGIAAPKHIQVLRREVWNPDTDLENSAERKIALVSPISEDEAKGSAPQ